MQAVLRVGGAAVVAAGLGACTSEGLSYADTARLEEMARSPNAGFKRFELDPREPVVWIVPLADADWSRIATAVCTRIPAVTAVKFYDGGVAPATLVGATPHVAWPCSPPRRTP